jgi:hypothetical protein
MPITIFDYVKSAVGDKEFYSAEDFNRNGVAMLGGCQGCRVTLAAYNAYPSTSGFWRCAECIGDTGFATVADFASAPVTRPGCFASTRTACPACGSTDAISETGNLAGELACGDCGQVW